MTANRTFFSTGSLLGFVPPALLLVGAATGAPWLAFVILVIVLTFMRSMFGDVTPTPRLWKEITATWLHYLPYAIAVCYIGCFLGLLFVLRWRGASGWDLLWYGLSQWAVSLYGSCVAHELLHRREQTARVLGRLLSGVIFYPALEHEHRMHHIRDGDEENAEWPAREESVWRFTRRRFVSALTSAWQSSRAMSAAKGQRWGAGLMLSVGTTLIYVTLFFAIAGWVLAATYLLASLVVMWSIQVITYLQHWGLGGRSDQQQSYSWEDLCCLQAWLTFNLSFHHAHHVGSALPYYRVFPTTVAPRPPAGYIVLFFCALVPRVWFSLMGPVLDAWRANPSNQLSVGRKLICFPARTQG